jgi:hypothetical protein
VQGKQKIIGSKRRTSSFRVSGALFMSMKYEVIALRILNGPKGDPKNTVEVYFADSYGIVAGVKITVKSKDTGIYPRSFTGQVETIYPAFALVRTVAGYRVTIHLSDLICSVVHGLIHGKAAAVRTVAATGRKEIRHADQALVSASL